MTKSGNLFLFHISGKFLFIVMSVSMVVELGEVEPLMLMLLLLLLLLLLLWLDLLHCNKVKVKVNRKSLDTYNFRNSLTRVLIELKCLKLCASPLKLFEQNHLWQRAQVFLTVQSQSFHPRPPLGPFSSTQFSGDSNLLGSPSKIKSIS